MQSTEHARVAEWVVDFAQDLPSLMPRTDWPLPGDIYWEPWRAQFVKHGVTSRVAAEAAMELAATPPEYLTQMLPTMMVHVRAIWRSAAVAPESTLNSAAHASRDCQLCSGNGLAVRWRHRPLAAGQAASEAFHCVCPLGRAIKANHRETAKDVAARILDLDDYVQLQAERFGYPPHLWPPPAMPSAGIPPRFSAMLARGMAVPADADGSIEHEDAAMFRPAPGPGPAPDPRPF